MPERLTRIPDTITAGDSVAVTLTLADYAAPTWSASLAIAGASVLTEDSTDADDGTSHDFDLSGTETAALASGAYSWRVRVTDGTTTTTAQTGSLVVLPDLASLAEGDAVGYAEKMLPIVEAALMGIVEGEAKMMMIAGRQLMSLSTAELMKLRAQFRAEMAAARNGGINPTIYLGRAPATLSVWE